MVHGVVNRHGGSVRVRSEPGGGTAVTLWFPAVRDRPMESPRPAAPPKVPPAIEAAIAPTLREVSAAPEDSPAMQQPRGDESRDPAAVSILVVEDEEHIRTMLVDALTGAGHRVESASDGLTGLARFEGGEFGAVLTDLSLPECSGLDVARSVKRMRPATPVVLITGWGHLLDPARLRASGVDFMLVKPFRLERLLAVLGDALRLRPSV